VSEPVRFVTVVAGSMMLTLALAFTAIYFWTDASEERQLDEALLDEAREEAREIADGRGEHLQISSRPGPMSDLGPLTKYAVLYDAEGHVLDATATFEGRPPARDALDASLGAPFDFHAPREELRAVLVEVPSRAGHQLLLAAPRTGVDTDARRLAQSMATVFLAAVTWMTVILTLVVRRYTRLHRSIAKVLRRVAEGDLVARVHAEEGSPEGLRLTRDLDELIARLETLVAAQHRFIAHAAHEIRTPLTALRAELGNAVRRKRGYEETVERAHELTVELSTLTDDLLELARLGATEMRPLEPVELLSVAQKVVDSLEPVAAQRSITIAVAGEPVYVEGRPLELHRLVRNLVDNAVAHSPDGSTIEVSVARSGAWAHLTVDDAGRGVPEGEREAIFEPFRRGRDALARDIEGTGLGLTIARTIARTHAGDVTVGESPAGGARFRVELPATGEPPR
jgi:two-component system heavy metal sensor histidine kinase CusS